MTTSPDPIAAEANFSMSVIVCKPTFTACQPDRNQCFGLARNDRQLSGPGEHGAQIVGDGLADSLFARSLCEEFVILYFQGTSQLRRAMNGSTLISKTVTLNIKQGLHIRACSSVIALVGNFDGQVRIRFGEKSADATSMFDLVQLAAPPGSELILEASGDGAEGVLNGLEIYLSNRTEHNHAN